MPYYPDKLTEPSQRKLSASTNTEPPWNPVRLSEAHVEMIKQYVHGVPIAKIANNFKRYGVPYSGRQIYRVVTSPRGQEFASLYSAHVNGGTQRLVEYGAAYSPEAMYTELGIMRNPLGADRHRLAAAQDLMDRVGPPKISRQETDNQQPTTVIINLTPSQLSQFAMPPAMIEAEVVALLDQPGSTND